MRCLLVPLLLMGCAGSACVPRDEASPTESLSTGGEAQVSAGGGGHGGIDGTSGSPPVSSDTGGLREGHEPTSLSPDCADSAHVSVVADCQDRMCRIPAGCFLMGRNPEEYPPGVYANEALVEVTLTRPFFIGQYEVTIEDWQKAGHPVPKGLPDSGPTGCYEPSCPVGHLSWYESLAYANWRSEQEGLAPCFELQGCSGTMGVDFTCESSTPRAENVYACEGYRLPTEAEWEYAARAGTRTTFYSGEITPYEDRGKCLEDEVLDPISWYCANSGNKAHPVGLKVPNGWGLYDASGNIAEWFYDGGYSSRPPGTHVDPVFRVSNPSGVSKYAQAGRGGGYYAGRASFHRAANRMSGFLDNSRRFPCYGFRLARTDHSSAGAGGANGGGP